MYVLASCVVVLIFYIECVSYVYVCVCCGSSYPTRRQNPPKNNISEKERKESKSVAKTRRARVGPQRRHQGSQPF